MTQATRQAQRRVKKEYYIKKGGRVTGGKDLGSTAAYTRSFAQSLFAAWQTDFNVLNQI